MAELDPNLIPPPSIGESKANHQAEADVSGLKKSKLWIVVVICVIVGVGLGIFVYQKSIAPAPVTTPRPTAAAKTSPLPIPSPSPVTPDISVVNPQDRKITFPKAGEIRVYFALYGANPTLSGHKIILSTPEGDTATVTMPAAVPVGDKMVSKNSGLIISAGKEVTVTSYDGGDMNRKSYGWIDPVNSKCGASYDIDIAPYVTWATQQSDTQPIVSIQCWGDWDPPNDNTNHNYNNFLVILSYVPDVGASEIPSASASVNPSSIPSSIPSSEPSNIPSSVPSNSPTASPSIIPSPSPSPSDIDELEVSPSPSNNVRVTMPEGSSLPDAGVFEVTAGTIGAGIILILLGFVGLLLI